MNQQSGIMGMVLPFAIIIAFFYFVAIRPQKKREKAHKQMIESITRGTTVVTAGGFYGKVCEVLEDSYIIDMGDETAGQTIKVRILKSSIAMTKDTAEAAERPKKMKRVKKVKKEETAQAESAAAVEAAAEEEKAE